MSDEGTPETLRQQLIDSYLAQGTDDEESAGVALAVFRDWLREQATTLRSMPPAPTRSTTAELIAASCVEHTARFLEQVLADGIDEELATDG